MRDAWRNAGYGNHTNVTFVSISVTPGTDTWESMAEFRHRYGGNWTYAKDQDGAFRRGYEVAMMDNTFVVTPTGRIAYEDTHVTSTSTLRSEVDAVLQEFGLAGGA